MSNIIDSHRNRINMIIGLKIFTLHACGPPIIDSDEEMSNPDKFCVGTGDYFTKRPVHY